MSENLFHSAIFDIDITQDLNCALVTTVDNHAYLYGLKNSEVLNDYEIPYCSGIKPNARLNTLNDIFIVGNNHGSISSYLIVDVTL